MASSRTGEDVAAPLPCRRFASVSMCVLVCACVCRCVSAIIKKAVDMYRVLGVVELASMSNLKDDNDVTERVVGSAEGDTPEYIAMFREPYVHASEEYFRRHARAWLAEAPVNVFIRKVSVHGALRARGFIRAARCAACADAGARRAHRGRRALARHSAADVPRRGV